MGHYRLFACEFVAMNVLSATSGEISITLVCGRGLYGPQMMNLTLDTWKRSRVEFAIALIWRPWQLEPIALRSRGFRHPGLMLPIIPAQLMVHHPLESNTTSTSLISGSKWKNRNSPLDKRRSDDRCNSSLISPSLGTLIPCPPSVHI
jgi:hypothetical protein